MKRTATLIAAVCLVGGEARAQMQMTADEADTLVEMFTPETTTPEYRWMNDEMAFWVRWFMLDGGQTQDVNELMKKWQAWDTVRHSPIRYLVTADGVNFAGGLSFRGISKKGVYRALQGAMEAVDAIEDVTLKSCTVRPHAKSDHDIVLMFVFVESGTLMPSLWRASVSKVALSDSSTSVSVDFGPCVPGKYLVGDVRKPEELAHNAVLMVEKVRANEEAETK